MRTSLLRVLDGHGRAGDSREQHGISQAVETIMLAPLKRSPNMGSIRYDGLTTHFDDRLLTHLQIVIIQKLLREEAFLMSWKDSAAAGDGRSSIWLSPNTSITFKFSGSRVPNVKYRLAAQPRKVCGVNDRPHCDEGRWKPRRVRGHRLEIPGESTAKRQGLVSTKL